MPTSGTTTWTLTASDIAHSAARELGAIGLSDSMDSTELAEMLRRLNAMLRTWGGEANMFREVSMVMTATGGDPAPALTANVRDVLSVRLIVSDTYKRPLTRWNRDQYLALPNRSQNGQPIAFYVTKGVDSLLLGLWPVPPDDVDLEIDYSRMPDTVTAGTETLDVPPEWNEAVIMGLASRCASIFGSTHIDPQTVGRIDERAMALYNRLLDRDRPDSYFMYGDCYA